MKNPLTGIPQMLHRKTPNIRRSMTEFENEFERLMSLRPFDWSEDINAYDFAPACDLRETEKEYIVDFDIPGIKKEDVSIEIEKNCLTISGERKQEKQESDSRHYLSETFYGSFLRSFNLPTAVNEEKVDAHYEDGVLTVKIPKLEGSKAKKIKVH